MRRRVVIVGLIMVTSVARQHDESDKSKYAICLFGSVSKWDKEGETIISTNAATDEYISLDAVHLAYDKHLFKPLMYSEEKLSRADVIDVFIHNWVPSKSIQDTILKLYNPTGHKFDDNAAWAIEDLRNHPRSSNRIQDRSMWTSGIRCLNMLMQHAESRGHPYDRIILSRPDMFHWSDFDMREYSDEMVAYNPGPPAMAPEMMCHPGHDCDIKGGSDFHIVMTMNQAKALATLADAFDSYDLTPHSGFLGQFMDKHGFSLSQDHFIMKQNVLTYKHMMFLIAEEPACGQKFVELYNISKEDLAQGLSDAPKFGEEMNDCCSLLDSNCVKTTFKGVIRDPLNKIKSSGRPSEANKRSGGRSKNGPRPPSANHESPTFESRSAQSGVGLGISLDNKYTERDGPIGNGMYPWATGIMDEKGKQSYIIDVGLPARFTARGPKTKGDGTCSYLWEFELTDRPSGVPMYDGHILKSGSGSTVKAVPVELESKSLRTDITFEITFDFPGTRTIQLTETCATEPQKSVEIKVHVMAVRREIRGLMQDDRDRFLDAFHKLWVLPTAEGRELYGMAYIDVHDLNNVHRQNAGTRDSDHFHEGVGFLMQHQKLSRRLEQSLQSIDPWLTLPYWDTSIDMLMVEKKMLATPFDGALWSDAFFGKSGSFEGPAATFIGDDAWMQAAILDGRWALSKVPRIGDGSVWGEAAAQRIREGHYVPHNSYGYLRSPWNQNPSPYVTRFSKSIKPNWATCDMLVSTLETSLASLDVGQFSQFWSYSAQFPPHPHAGLHDAIGGVLHEQDTDKVRQLFSKYFKRMIPDHSWEKFNYQWWILTQKGIWRSWIADFPSTCDDSVSITDCKMACTDRFPRETVGRTVAYFLNGEHLSAPALPGGGSWFTRETQFSDPKNHDLGTESSSTFLKEIGDAFCDSIGVTLKGENFESSGVLDPTFWLIHPTTDRLFQASFLQFEEKLYSHGNTVDAEHLISKIWPERGFFCGSLADCLTCHGVQNWLVRAQENAGMETVGACMDPTIGPNVGVHGSDTDSLKILMRSKDECCYGHGKDDQLFTQFSANSLNASVEGPRNSDVLRMVLPNQGPQWELGGTVVYGSFRFDHCEVKRSGKNKVHDVIFGAKHASVLSKIESKLFPGASPHRDHGAVAEGKRPSMLKLDEGSRRGSRKNID